MKVNLFKTIQINSDLVNHFNTNIGSSDDCKVIRFFETVIMTYVQKTILHHKKLYRV